MFRLGWRPPGCVGHPGRTTACGARPFRPSAPRWRVLGQPFALPLSEVGVVSNRQIQPPVYPRRLSGTMGCMARDVSDDNPLTPEEALDSDEVRNDDGDEVVDPPKRWIDAREDESLDERLADETPDVSPDDIDLRDADDTGTKETVTEPGDALDRLDPEQHGRERGQIDGTPEDGDSFYDVVE